MENENTQEFIPLGKKLKQISEKARAANELARLVAVLEEYAGKGEVSIKFNDLREYIPTMIMNNTAWDWFKQNEINVSGGINNTTGNYEYTLRWE